MVPCTCPATTVISPKTWHSPRILVLGVQLISITERPFDPDGILQLYSHGFGKNGSSTTAVEWAALDNRCLVRGVCGINSYCSLKSKGQPNCLCPPGFEFVDPSQILLGCRRNSSIGDCLENSSGANTGLTMVTMRNTTWVDKPYSILPSTTSIDDCKAACVMGRAYDPTGLKSAKPLPTSVRLLRALPRYE